MPFCVIRFVVVKKDLEMGLDRVIMDQSYGCNLRNSDILRLLNFFFCSIVTLINLKQNRSYYMCTLYKSFEQVQFLFFVGPCQLFLLRASKRNALHHGPQFETRAGKGKYKVQ